MVQLKLPIPLSDNRYYFSVGNRKVLSQEGRNYKSDVYCLAREGKINFEAIKKDYRVSMKVITHFRDKRVRDILNLSKCLCDALVYAELMADDSLIDDAYFKRGEINKEDPHIELFLFYGEEREVFW